MLVAKGGIAYVASTPMSPGELFWLKSGAETPAQLTHVNQPLLDEVIVQPTHEVHYSSYDDSKIQGWYILPLGYQEGKRYPLIVHIHGGPRVMLSPSSKMWHEWQVHAAWGYVVFYCNAHGSDGYGQEFQRFSYGEPDKQQQSIAMLREQMRRLTQLTEGLVTMSHLDGGKTSIFNRPISTGWCAP